ncbi:ATP-binding cassette domain-containing protein [bacterium]|nr:ATP-binding cassette domain-containing protein [bacterium]
MLQTQDITFSYSSDKTFHFPDIQVDKCGYLVVLGNSGKGKTTLLHLLAGFLTVGSGQILINNSRFHEMRGAKRDIYRARHIGVIFQVPHFINSLTLEQNILLAQKLARKQPDKKKVTQMLERLNLQHRAHAAISKLSQGELQRASIIRGIINEPALVLADEPTSSLDDENCNRVIQLLEEQSDLVNAALVVVTHDQRIKDFFTNQISL